MGSVDVKIFIFKFLKLFHFISDFDRVCGRLYGFVGACMSDPHAYKVAVPFKSNLEFRCQMIESSVRLRKRFCEVYDTNSLA